MRYKKERDTSFWVGIGAPHPTFRACDRDISYSDVGDRVARSGYFTIYKALF
jgi:hypothetical protein